MGEICRRNWILKLVWCRLVLKVRLGTQLLRLDRHYTNQARWLNCIVNVLWLVWRHGKVHWSFSSLLRRWLAIRNGVMSGLIRWKLLHRALVLPDHLAISVRPLANHEAIWVVLSGTRYVRADKGRKLLDFNRLLDRIRWSCGASVEFLTSDLPEGIFVLYWNHFPYIYL